MTSFTYYCFHSQKSFAALVLRRSGLSAQAFHISACNQNFKTGFRACSPPDRGGTKGDPSMLNLFYQLSQINRFYRCGSHPARRFFYEMRQ